MASASILSLFCAGDPEPAPWLARVDALFDRHDCEALYLDVGTNVGVQLHKLFEPAKFGGSPVLRVFDELFGVDRFCRTCAIGIEPNPRHTQRLDTLESALGAAGAGVIVLRGAAGTSESHVTLSLPKLGNKEGVDLDARVGAFTARNNGRATPRELRVTVPQFDLGAIIRHVHGRLPAPRRLLMKLDVEGQEYRILPDLMLSQSFCLLNKVFLEWHPDVYSVKQLSARPRTRVLVGAKRRGIEAAHALSQAITAATAAAAGKPDCAVELSALDDETYLTGRVPWPRSPVCAKHSTMGVPGTRVVGKTVPPITETPVSGYCSETLLECTSLDRCTHCSTGYSGHWKAHKHNITSLEDCARACAGCRNCAFVSFLPSERSCEWHSECQAPLHPLAGALSRAVASGSRDRQGADPMMQVSPEGLSATRLGLTTSDKVAPVWKTRLAGLREARGQESRPS